MRSALYHGVVSHDRTSPSRHAFSYRVFLPYLDLAELDVVFARRLLWSARRPAIAWFRRADHFGDPNVPLDASVRSLVAARLGRVPTGPIRLLTHLRYFGWVTNPVSFYYCFEEDGVALDAIVAEVTNTPWGERHLYVLDARAAGPSLSFSFRKEFHVSPFMGMAQDYHWTFSTPGDELFVTMTNREDGRDVLQATMRLSRRPLAGRELAKALLRHPVMTATVSFGIYWQALRLWWKRTPFHPHPRHAVRPKGAS